MKMNKAEFRNAIQETAAVTGFSPALVEKDYHCSVILKKIYEHEFLKTHLVFKGGTLLAKCYLSFFRMSEDLDFSVKNELCAERKDRRKLADAIRAVIPDLLAETGFREVSPFRGFNESRQYNAVFGYESLFLLEDTIKFEVGFRGDLMLAPVRQPLQTLLRDAYNPQKSVISPFEALVLSHQEAYAEKVRAALSRQIPAIRDFYDITAIADSGFDLSTPDFIALVARKLAADKSAQIDLSEDKQRALQERIKGELQGVLKNNSLFTLDASWKILEAIAEKVASRKSE